MESRVSRIKLLAELNRKPERSCFRPVNVFHGVYYAIDRKRDGTGFQRQLNLP